MFEWLFDTSGFPPRWHCGAWPLQLGYLHIFSDMAIWAAYMSIPLALAYYMIRRKNRTPFPPLIWLFAGFIFFCGTTHLVDAIIFYEPLYRLSGVLKFGTAIVSWATALVLFQFIPVALTVPELAEKNTRLARKVQVGRRRERKLDSLRAELERRVKERTWELEREIAERKKTEEELRNREMELLAIKNQLETGLTERGLELNRQIALNSAIVESSEDAILGKDLEGNIISWNEGAEEIYGYTAEEAIGKHITLIIPEDRRHEAKDLMERARGGSDIRRYETIRRHKDGREFNVSISLSPLYIDDEQIIGVSTIERDISQVVAAREKLETYARQLEASNQALQQFAYVASHDLKAPLRAVSGYVQLVKKRYQEKLDDDANRFIDGAVEAVNQMQELINALLSLSRVQRADREFTYVDLNTAAKKAIDNLKVDIEEAGAEVILNELPTVSGDAALLLQLFQNMIGNAIKFRGEEKPVVEVKASRKDGQWLLSVSDNGIGIRTRYKERIFDIFKRLNSARKYQGTGIGLAICRRIVQHHGGRIWVESEPGIGSTFYIMLPQKG